MSEEGKSFGLVVMIIGIFCFWVGATATIGGAPLGFTLIFAGLFTMAFS